MSETTKDVNLTRMVKPKFLTLTGAPANQVAFKIVREDGSQHIQRRRVAKRTDKLLTFEFDAEKVSDAEIATAMENYGVTEFTIETQDKWKVVKCADAGDQPTMRIRLDENSYVTVLKPISNVTDAKRSVSVVQMEFAADYFPKTEDVEAWCKANSVDFLPDRAQNAETSIIVARGEVPKDAETRKIEVDSGVQFVVMRAEQTDIPGNFIAVVNDAAYGSWGWGQLDFAASMADVAFCHLSREGQSTLNNVIDRILYYSDLPINVRKDLIVSAAAQFADFIVTLMDALPARVVIASRSSLEKEKSMSNTKAPAPAVTRSEPAPAATTEATPAAAPVAAAPATTEAAPAAAAPEAPITRSDVQGMIDASMNKVTGELGTKIDALRSILEKSPAATTPATTDAQRADGAAPAAEPTLADVMRAVTEMKDSVKGVGDRVGALESHTTVRSDAGDGKQTTQRGDVFKGMFAGGKPAASA